MFPATASVHSPRATSAGDSRDQWPPGFDEWTGEFLVGQRVQKPGQSRLSLAREPVALECRTELRQCLGQIGLGLDGTREDAAEGETATQCRIEIRVGLYAVAPNGELQECCVGVEGRTVARETAFDGSCSFILGWPGSLRCTLGIRRARRCFLPCWSSPFSLP